MKYNGVIQRKFALLDKHTLELKARFGNLDFEKVKNDWALRMMTERSLQIMTEIVIDVCERILAIENAGPAATASENVDKLVSMGILKSKEPYVTMVRFRNLIVHQYEEIDPAIVYDIAKNRLDDFRRFRDEIDIR